MSEHRRRSALAHRDDRHAAHGLSVRLREIADRAMIDVRGLTSDPDFMSRTESALGLTLPQTPRTSASRDGLTVLWLSVDQWLVTAPHGEAAELVSSLTEKLQGVHSLVADMSDARAIFRLEGDNVREVLNKGTSVDFTASEHVAGSVRRILFAQVAALTHVVSERPDVIDLYVFRSYADHVWRYILAVGRDGARIKLFGRQPASSGDSTRMVDAGGIEDQP
jgi:sarcosine oxidase subunit gamma